MSRTAVYSALVLRNRPSGESNSEVTLLTAEEGIIRSIVFGGPKSKLRAHSAPYNSGQIWVYCDKSKDYAKLSDFDVRSWRPGLRELYDRTMAASAIAETILSTHGGGGDWSIALNLAETTLDTLENANEELCERLLVHFLWRWAGFLGVQPHVECCSGCDSETASNEPLWYNAREGIAHCTACANFASNHANSEHFSQNQTLSTSGLIKLNPGCRRWFAAVSEIDPSHLHRYSMDKKTFDEAKSLVTAVLAAALGKRLASWNW